MSGELPTAVVALGGNALLPRGERVDASTQMRAARGAARRLAPAAERFRLLVTHGNGPQVGLLALMGEAPGETSRYPLDVLDAETEGQIGYLIELELGNAIAGVDTVALITRVEVDPGDPAFGSPVKFVGPVYSREEADRLQAERGWSFAADGEDRRRVVPSPEPQRIVELSAIRKLADAGFLVVCAGGGGVPVVAEDGGHRGVEAVIDKDLCSALLATDLGAELLVLATDVPAVFCGFDTPEQRAVGETTPAALRGHDFAAGSMGPKVEAACRFVEAGGRRAAIGALDDVGGLLDGTSGTQVRAATPPIERDPAT